MTSPRLSSRRSTGRLAAATAAAALALGTSVTPLRPIAAEGESLRVARQLNQAFIEVTEAVTPSVVVIHVLQKPDPAEQEQRREFRKLLKPDTADDRELEEESIQGQGSGVIIRPDGYIVTNFHVVDGADKIRVRLQDGREFDAAVRGTHAEADLAVLRLQGSVTNLAALRFADSRKVRVGEFAIAVGAPFELDYSVTFGHVSAKGRGNLHGGPLEQDFIQTDAAINLGNRGGPLVNLDGEVIGITSMIPGVGSGSGFAIPASQVRLISDRIIAEGTFRRSWLGIAMPSTFEMQQLKGPQPGHSRGVLVKSIQPDGPASRSQLEAGDLITAVDGKSVMSRGQLVAEVALKPPGRDVQLEVLREDKALQITVRPEAMPEAMMAMRPNPHVRPDNPVEPDGAELRKLTPELAREFSVKGLTAGVLVTGVAEDSISGAVGLAKGDVITAVNGKLVTTPREYRQALRSSKTKRTKVAVQRDGSRTVVFFENRSE